MQVVRETSFEILKGRNVPQKPVGWMELEGQLNPALSLPEVLQFLSMGKMTGSLTISHGEYTVSLILRNGKLVNSSSLERPRRIGQMLVSRGTISRRALEEALQIQRKQTPSTLLGRILVDRGSITMEQLRQTIRLQLEEEMWDLFAMPEGSFKFEHGADMQMGDVVVELDLEPLILEGTRRLDEWARIVKNIPGDHSVPCVRALEDTSDRDMMQFSDAEWRVLSLVNSYYNVGSIASRSGVGKFETYRILNSFLASGMITLLPVEAASEIVSLMQFAPERIGAGKRPKDVVGQSSAGYSSSRLLSMLIGRKAEEAGAPKVEDRSPLLFLTPVAFVAGLANSLIDELVNNPDFYVGPEDEHIPEHIWRHIVNNYPKADLVSCKDARLDSRRFDRYVEMSGLKGALRSAYEETMEALGRYLKMLFLLASQRLGMRRAQEIFGVRSKDFTKRATIVHSEGFRFDDYAGKVYV